MNKLFALLLVFALILGMLGGCRSVASSAAVSAIGEAISESVQAEQEEAVFEKQEKPAEELVEESMEATDAELEEMSEMAEAEPTSMDYQVTLPICEVTETYTMWMDVSPVVAGAVRSADDMESYGVIEERTGIRFDLTIVSGMEATAQFPLMIAAEDYTDIISHMSYYSTGVAGALSDGVIVDIYDDVVQYAPHYWAYISSRPNCQATMLTSDGEMGALATVVQEAGLENSGLVIHGEWLEALGMDRPETFDELHEFGTQCLEQYGAAFCFPSDGNCTLLSMGLGVLAGEYMALNEQVRHYIQVPEYYDYLRMAADWYSEGLIYKDFYTLNDISANGNLFCSGDCSLNQLNANIMTVIYEKVDPASGTWFIGIPSPVTEKGGTLPVSTEVQELREADTWSISAACDPERIAALMQLVDYLYSDEGSLLYNYGVEGRSFEYDVDGNPCYTELVTDSPDGTSFPVAVCIYATINAPSRMDSRKDCFAFNQDSWDAMEIFATQVDGTGSFPSAAEAALSAEEMERYTAVSGDVETYVDAEILKFITGAAELTEDSYARFVETAVSMGLNEMVALYQTAYNRYMEKITQSKKGA